MFEVDIDYTAVIRTLGTAGKKYKALLSSLASQTISPKAIIVYIAEGYSIPKETIGIEQYVFVKKGMVAQRALPYNEVETDYILVLDDDLEFPPNTVERMFQLLKEHDADVISPDIFPNAKRSWKSELMMTISGRMRARRYDDVWGYKVMRNSGYSYNANPYKDIYISQTNAGAVCLCKKKDFIRIKFEEEQWLDKQPYAMGDDQVMFYKMYLNNLKILTWFKHEIVHLDAGENYNPNKINRTIYSDFYFKTIFWHRFIFSPEKKMLTKLWSCICIGYTFFFALLISLVKLDVRILNLKWRAIIDGVNYTRSKEYNSIPKINSIYLGKRS